MPPSDPSFAVIVPAFNAAKFLKDCLGSLEAAGFDLKDEVWVIDDGSKDETAQIARDHEVHLTRHERSKGAAAARVAGAQGRRVDILLFVDADVLVAPDTKKRIIRAFANPDTAAVFGAYDAFPTAPGLVSRYRNLLHRYVHLTSAGKAQTFWTGLGAVRRAAYEAVGGIDPTQRMMEDVEFGMRLAVSGHTIVLDPEITGTHQKHWSLSSLVKTDLFDRAIPWSRLLAQNTKRYGGLNLSPSRKGAAVASAGVGLGLISSPFWQGGMVVLLLSTLAFIVLSWPFFRWLAGLRGVAFAAGAVLPHLVHNWCALAGYSWVRLEQLRFGGNSSPSEKTN